MLVRVVCAVVALAPAQAFADGLAVVGGSPRAIGRAGAATVGDDGGGALLINPAAMARRTTTRLQLGMAAVDDELDWQSRAVAAPRSTGQAGSRLAPLGAAVGALGSWSLGVGVLAAGVSARQLARPSDAPGSLGTAYDYRYAGIAGTYRRDSVAVAAARRLGDSLAVGLSLALSRVTVSEHRRLWAGLAGRDSLGDPRHDVDLELDAAASASPSATLGVLYAPDDSQLELGASVSWAASVRLDGDVRAWSGASGPRVESDAPRASLAVRQPMAMRAGARYVGARVVGELGGELWLVGDAAERAVWELRGVQLVDPSGQVADVTRVASRISQRSRAAVRLAADIELVPGFLWATAGYALASQGTPSARMSPSFGELGGHTAALGVEASAGSVTITLGWSRTWTTSSGAASALSLDNPFGIGDGRVPPGAYDGAVDQAGLLVELDLGGGPGR